MPFFRGICLAAFRVLPVWLFFMLLSFSMLGQGEANTWYFGSGAGMDFNGGPPVALSNSSMMTSEGCASISDANGNLLFYTEGGTVWNANHAIMTNGTGLLGHSSSTQSSVIVPKPNSPGFYYIFTTPIAFINNGSGLRYTEVDMSLQGGLGAVTNNKNLLVTPAALTEKMTAVANGTNTGYWILCPLTTGVMQAFEVTAAGVNTTPVLSTVGSLVGLQGQMKASPDGKWLAWGLSTLGQVYQPRLARFDAMTGQVTADTNLPYSGFIGYGVAFSATSNFLYLNNAASFGAGQMQQYDLALGSFSAIVGSMVNVSTTAFVHSRGLQLGPDKKIYAVGSTPSALDVIHFPDSAGSASGYQHAGFSLATGTIGIWGLPNFLQSIFTPTYYVWQDTCFNDTTTFFEVNQVGDSILWDFGDTASGSANYAEGDSVGHVFSAFGTYSVIATAYFMNNTGYVSFLDSLLDTMTVNIHPYPEIDLGSDTILCEGDSIEIVNSNTLLMMDYLWSDSSTAVSLPIFEADTYYVEVSTVCGVAFDTIVIDSVIPALVNLGPDSTFCVGDTVTFELNLPLAQYQWQDNDTSSVYDATATGWYSVTATGVCNTHHDSVFYSFVAPPATNMPDDTVFCDGNFASLEVTGDSVSYLWQDSSTLDFFQAFQADTYSVIVSGPCAVFYDTTIVLIDSPLTIDLGNDTVLCEGVTHWHPANVPERVTLFWSDSTTVDSFYIDEPLTLWLAGYNTCNADTDTLVVQYEVPPVVSLPEEMLFCTGESYEADVTFSRSQYQWSHGSVAGIVTLTQEATYIVTVTNLCGQDIDTMELLVDYPLDIDLGGPYDICDGDSVFLDATSPNRPQYVWNNTAIVANRIITKAGLFRVTVTNTCGSYSDEAAVYLTNKPTSALPADTVICTVYPWEIDLVRNYKNLQWVGGASTSDFTIDTSGTYWLSMQNECGWSTDTFRVKFTDPPIIDLGVDTFVCPSIGTFMLDAGKQEGLLYLWQNGSREQAFEVTESGNYSLEVTNADGCVFDEHVFVGDCPIQVWIPTAFSPNSDQVNDVFLPQLSFVTDYELIIYDRWGHPLFKTGNLDEGWDGTFGSDLMPSGVYSYSLDFKADELGLQQLRGAVTLIR